MSTLAQLSRFSVVCFDQSKTSSYVYTSLILQDDLKRRQTTTTTKPQKTNNNKQNKNTKTTNSKSHPYIILSFLCGANIFSSVYICLHEFEKVVFCGFKKRKEKAYYFYAVRELYEIQVATYYCTLQLVYPTVLHVRAQLLCTGLLEILEVLKTCQAPRNICVVHACA